MSYSLEHIEKVPAESSKGGSLLNRTKPSLKMRRRIGRCRRNSVLHFFRFRPFRNRLEDDLKRIASYDENWWKQYDAEKPEAITYNNVRAFLNFNPNDVLLKGAEVLPKQNATLLIEWNLDAFMCSLNIGEQTFSYSILTFDGAEPLIGEASTLDKKAIQKFFERLSSIYKID